MEEIEILHQAIDRLKEQTGAEVKITATELLKPLSIRGTSIATIQIQLGKKKSALDVEITRELRGKISVTPSQLKKKNTLIISQYIPKPFKEALKKHHINYLELPGNCYIETSELYIYINDQQVTETRIPAKGKIWKPSGLRFLFVILQDPGLLNASYRKIASIANVALGNIGPFLKELKTEGYIVDTKNNKGTRIMIFENKLMLMQRWAELYNGVLKSKLLIGTFRFMNKQDLKGWKLLFDEKFKWGGENAGALLTNYLQPEYFTMYTKHGRQGLMKDLRLVPDPKGNIEMVEQFWSDELNHPASYQNIVPPVLAYAELITSFDSRNQETALRIKEKYLE